MLNDIITATECIELVEELNDILLEDEEERVVLFEFRYIGYEYGIYFMGSCIWSYENDEREYFTNDNVLDDPRFAEDQREDLRTFIVRQYNALRKSFPKIK